MKGSRARKFYPVAEPDIGKREERYVVRAIRSGWVSSLGKYVNEFESGFAEFCECSEGISTSSGTAALHLALAALGVGPHDEVVVPALTFVATASPVAYLGATTVFADCDPTTWCVSAETISKAITPKTKVIVVVHLYGQPADMDPILDLAAERQLTVIEDAAEAHGALYKGRKVGSLGRLGVFSFYGNKLITSGEGGMITTKDESLAQRVRFLRDHAMSAERRYFHPEIGYNYRITNLQAALGVAQLERIAGFIAQRRRVMEWYREALGHRSDLTLNPALPWAESANWMVSVLLPRGVEADEIARSLRESGIDTRPFFHPLHQLPPFAQFHQCHMPVAEDLSRRGLNLPTSGRLRKADVRYIARALERAVDHSCNSVASWLGGEERHLSR